MKRLIGILAKPESTESLVNYIKGLGAVSEVISPLEILKSNVSEILKISPKVFESQEPLTAPVVLQEHHVRHFFTKSGQGIASVTPYAGKTLDKPDLILGYFAAIGLKAFGPSFMGNLVYNEFSEKPDGVYLATDLSQVDSVKLKENLSNRYVSIFATNTEAEDYVKPVSLGIDHVLNIGNGSKSTIKRVATTLLSQLKEKWKGEKI